MTTRTWIFICVPLTIGATAIARILTHVVTVRVLRTTHLPKLSAWTYWTEIERTYAKLFPDSRLLFWRRVFTWVGAIVFIVMLVGLLFISPTKIDP